VDIGPTGEWGRPVDERQWRKFCGYPTHVWAQNFFRQPDVVLIDGRFRAACFLATCLRINKKTTILFDDYLERHSYHVIEQLALPVALHGRMAEFHVEPIEDSIWAHDLFNSLLGDIALSSANNYSYSSHEEKIYPFVKK
jgi:hypothetical protein